MISYFSANFFTNLIRSGHINSCQNYIFIYHFIPYIRLFKQTVQYNKYIFILYIDRNLPVDIYDFVIIKKLKIGLLFNLFQYFCDSFFCSKYRKFCRLRIRLGRKCHTNRQA